MIDFRNVVFIAKRLPEGFGYAFEAVPEGARPAPHLPLQREGLWAEFTARIRAEKDYPRQTARG